MPPRCAPFEQSMNADFIAGLEFWEREKGVSREVLMAAVEEALLQAAKKAVGPARVKHGNLVVLRHHAVGHDEPGKRLDVAGFGIHLHAQFARRLKADAK